MFACRDVHIDNIKTVSEIGWDDGIDVVSCKNVLIENCFLRNKDDCIAIKAGWDMPRNI
ncbi:MAG: glycosyl hydrolase family 28 protein [Bacilli bacterium]